MNAVTANSSAQIGRVKNGSRMPSDSVSAAAQALVEDVAEHEAEHERRNRIVVAAQEERADADRAA